MNTIEITDMSVFIGCCFGELPEVSDTCTICGDKLKYVRDGVSMSLFKKKVGSDIVCQESCYEKAHGKYF